MAILDTKTIGVASYGALGLVMFGCWLHS